MKVPELKEETFLQLAKEEDNCEIAVGSLDGVFQRKQNAVPETAVPVTKYAFGTLINLQRRKRDWTLEELATEAQIDLDEAVSIEENPTYRPAPRSVLQLARVLVLPIQKLLVLSGNAEFANVKLETAAVRFAARSRAVEKLTEAEARALNEFVAALVEDDEESKVSS
jgi:hypothetical protein